MTHIVLLSGGSGTRLWPLSNQARSKQFLKVLRGENNRHISMVQRVFLQIESVDADLDVTIATSATQADVLSSQVGDRFELVTEPERRDTAPAIMLACAHLDLVQGAKPDDVVIVMPIDTYADQAYYDQIPLVASCVARGKSDLVLMGVEPTYPAERYGYILPQRSSAVGWPVVSFKEKPNQAMATEYISRGGLWNCGVFGFRLGWLRDITRSYVDVPDYEQMLKRYCELPRNSFDYEVVEKAKNILVIPYKGMWKDLGTWDVLAEELEEPSAGNVLVDDATSSNVFAINELGIPMVVAGISDAVAIATADGILVAGKEASPRVKQFADEVTLPHPMCESHSWGSYRVLDEEQDNCTKLVSLVPKAVMSEESCAYATKVWTILAGRGCAVVDGTSVDVGQGDVVRIAEGQSHSLQAVTHLSAIETCIGMRGMGDTLGNGA